MAAAVKPWRRSIKCLAPTMLLLYYCAAAEIYSVLTGETSEDFSFFKKLGITYRADMRGRTCYTYLHSLIGEKKFSSILSFTNIFVWY